MMGGEGDLEVRPEFESWPVTMDPIFSYPPRASVFSSANGAVGRTNAIVNVCKVSLRGLGRYLAPRGCCSCFDRSWSGNAVVYKYVLHAFDSFIEAQLLIVNGLSPELLFLRYHL